MNDLLTPKEVADYLRLNVRTVKAMIYRNDLASIIVNKRGDHRIRKSELARFVGEKNL